MRLDQEISPWLVAVIVTAAALAVLVVYLHMMGIPAGWSDTIGSRRRLQASAEAARYPNGWHVRDPGTWPWGAGPDRGNSGGYACLHWNTSTETWDTLISRSYDMSALQHARLYVRTLYRFGRPGPDDTCRPTARIVGTTDNWRTSYVVRDYGEEDFVGNESLDISTWAAGHRDVKFAWVAHTYDSTNIRYWCIDDVSTSHSTLATLDVAVLQVAYPPPGMLLAPGDTLGPTVIIGNTGCTGIETFTFSMTIDSNSVFYGEDSLRYAERKAIRASLGTTQRYHGSPPAQVLSPGRHTLTAIITLFQDIPGYGRTTEAGPDNNPANDTLVVELLVAADTWQRVPGEYPMPDRTVRAGFAVAGGPEGIYVRNPGGTAPGERPMSRQFMAWLQVANNWASLPDFHRLQKADYTGSITLSGACVAQESLFYCQVADGEPLMVYNTRTRRWSVTAPPLGRERHAELTPGFSSGVCWDGLDRLYVAGRHHVFWYSIDGDSWGFVIGGRDSERPARLTDTCPTLGDIAFSGEWLRFLSVNRQFTGYSPGWHLWQIHETLPGSRQLEVCRLAADPENDAIYMLTDAEDGLDRCFVGYDQKADTWMMHLPQPRWGTPQKQLLPGAQLVRSGRYLFAFSGWSNDLWMYNLPSPPLPPSRRYWH